MGKRFFSKINIYNTILAIVSIFLFYYDFENFINKISLFDFFVFLLLAFSSEFLSVNLPRYGYVSVAFAVDLATILLYGPLISSVIAVISYVITAIIQKRLQLQKLLFNTFQIFITVNVSAYFYLLLGGVFSVVKVTKFAPIIGCAIIYSLVNISLFALCYSFINNVSFREFWLTNIKTVVPNFLALIPIGVMIAYLYQNIGFIAVVFFFIPLLMSRHTFKLYMSIREMYLDTISSLASTIDAKDKYTLGHSDRVSQYSVAIAKEMKLPEDEIENLKYIALLHDIGKIAIPEKILNKPTKLSNDEYEIMKYHAELGAEIVKQIKFLKGHEAIRYHHERYDGDGYPDKLAGENIPLAARIISVADCFDAMTTDRPYRAALSIEDAFAELEKCSKKQFDEKVVQAFKRVYPTIKLEPQSAHVYLPPEDLRERINSISGGDVVAL